MDQLGFGEVLRRTRERKGLDLNATARRLRIRPDILDAIECGRFESMPPRGYTRNMVNGYARYLGLNPTEITTKYLEEYDGYQLGIAQSRRRPSGIDMSEAPENTRIPHRISNERNAAARRDAEAGIDRAQDLFGAERRTAINAHNNRRTQVIDDESTFFNRNRAAGLAQGGQDGRESTANGQRVRNQREAGRVPRGAGDSERGRGRGLDVRPQADPRTNRSRNQGRTHQARGSVIPNTAYTNFYSGPQNRSGMQQKLPFIIAAVVILVIVIVISFVLFGNKPKATTETTPNVPVTGLDSSSEAKQQVTEVAPTKFTFTYTVAEGSTSWIEVYVDNAVQVAETVTGPSTKSFDCSGTLQFICASTTGVTATQDGAALTLTPDTDGIVNMTIKFSDVLAKWNTDHPNASSSTSTKTSTSTSTSASTTATTSSSTATTASTSATTQTT